MEPITSSLLLSVIGSHIANYIPALWGPGIDDMIETCYRKALNHWNPDIADRYKYKEEQLKPKLLDYIKGKAQKDPEIEKLLGLWVVEMQAEPACAALINKEKIEALSGQLVKANEDVVFRIDNIVPALKSLIKEVGKQVGNLDVKVDALNAKMEEFLASRKMTQFVCLNERLAKSGVLPNDISAKRLIDGSYWLDEENIVLALKGVKERDFFVIKGSEGRGKSVLSYFVGLKLIQSESFNVFITERSWAWTRVRDELETIRTIPGSKLIILENIHQASDDMSAIFGYARDYKSNNMWFLMNSRPTYKNEGSSELNDLGDDDYLDLDVLQDERAVYIAEYLTTLYGLMAYELTVEKKPLRKNLPPNLRVLSNYFQIYKDIKRPPYDVNEGKILHLFYELFLKEPELENYKDTLMKLGALNIFDVPLDTSGISKEERKFLKKYADKGLCYEQGGALFLPHSTDAVFLCKAICAKDLKRGEKRDALFESKVSEAIIAYYDNLIEKYKLLGKLAPNDIARDFCTFNNSLYQSGSFKVLLRYYREPEKAKEVIKSICPRYVLDSIRLEANADNEEMANRLKIYTDSVSFIRNNISNYNCSLFGVLQNNLRYYGYPLNRLVNDLFYGIDKNVLKEWLMSHSHINTSAILVRAMKKIDICKETIEEVRRERPFLFSQNTARVRNLKKISRLLSESVDRLRKGKSTLEEERLTIEFCLQETPGTILIPSSNKGAHYLTRIFDYLRLIDINYGTFYKDLLIHNDAVYKDALLRLDFFDYSDHYFDYYSFFYDINAFPVIYQGINRKIINVEDYQIKQSMAHWLFHCRRLFLWEKKNLIVSPFKEESLAYDIEKILLEDVPNRIRSFNYGVGSFNYIAGFYNDYYPDIKESINDLISNVTDNDKRAKMRIWVNYIRSTLPPKTRNRTFYKGSLPYAIEQALNETETFSRPEV